MTPLENLVFEEQFEIETVRMFLEWGGKIESPASKEHYIKRAYKLGQYSLMRLLQSGLGGRRCEITNMSTRVDLNGKTCVVEEYLPDTDQYKVTLETSKEVLKIKSQNLKRRDRTPEDCGYFVEFKNGRTVRHDFASKDDCQAFLTSFDGENSMPAVVDAEAEARANQAAADLLAELGFAEEDDVTVKGNKSKTGKSSTKGKNKGKNK